MAKRITSSAVNWALITEVLTVEKPQVFAVKAQSEKYLRDIASKPAELPAINWSYYKSRIQNASMVDSFQKSYEALKVPFPVDKAQADATEATNQEINKHAEKMYAQVIKDIDELKKKIAELEKVMKYSEMTLEEFYLARPDMRLDSETPRFWPQHYPFDEVERADDDKDHH